MMPTSPLSLENTEHLSEPISWCEKRRLLTIDWTETIRYHCIVFVPTWDSGLKWWTELPDEIYHPDQFTEMDINLVAETDNTAVQQWQSTIPEEILAALRPFKSWSFSLLQMAHQWREVYDLLTSNPLLVWLAKHYAVIRGLSHNAFRTLLNRKQHQILAAIGLTGTKSAVRTLRRIQLDSYMPTDFFLVKDLWKKPDLVASLTHQQKIDRSFMRLIKQLPWIAGRPLAKTLDAIECPWQYEELIRLIADIRRMSDDRRQITEQLANARSFAAVENLHNQLVELFNAGPGNYDILLDDDGQPLPFPELPHPGTESIHPILTVQALKDEGKRMNHCVGSYARRVQDGEYYVYHMESPQPLTVGIKMREGRIIGCEQVKGIGNARPEKLPEEIVHQWVRRILNRNTM